MRGLIGLVLLLSSTSLCLAAPARLPLEARPLKYAVTLTPHLDAKSFDGSARITLAVPKATSTVTLHALELEISRAGVGDNPATVRLDPAAQTATLTFARPLPAGQAMLELRWTGKLSSELHGLYYAEADGRRFAFTDFEPTEARRAFPCFDEPDIKARFQMTAVINPIDVAVSNAPIVSERLDSRHRRKTVSFAETPPLSTYLVALAVGPLVEVHASVGKIPVRVYTMPGKAALGKYALGEATRFLPWFESYFGIPYPYGKLDLVAVPDFEAGAMENAGAIFFRETFLLADERATPETLRKISVTVAHEIAHQWFGDLVTMKWWDDLWLNEAFATWAENRSTAAVHASWEPWLDFHDWREEAVSRDALAGTHPIFAPINNPEEAHEAFDAITYAKGASVLRMIERWLGEENFRRGVSAYLRAHIAGNATGDDLWQALATASDRPVAEVAKSWIHRAGHPLVTVTASCKDGKTELALAQERDGRVAVAATAAVDHLWLIPLCARTPEGTRCGLMKETRETRVVSDSCQPWVLANADGAGFFRVRYGGDSLAAIGQAAPASLTAEERARLVADSWALARDGKLPLTAYLQLAQDLRDESRRDVVTDIGQHLLQVGAELVADGDRAAWQRYVSELYGHTAETLGWDARAGEPEEARRLRAAVLEVLGEARVQSVLLAAVTRMQRYLGGDAAAVEPSLLPTVAGAAAYGGDAARWQAYLQRMRTAPTPEERQQFLDALTRFEAPALVDKTLALTLTGDVRTQDVAGTVRELLEHAWSRRAAWTFVQKQYPQLRARVPEYMMTKILGGVSSFCDAQQLAEAQRFFAGVRFAGKERRLQQAVEDAQACIDLKKRERGNLATWLRARPRHAALLPQSARN